MSLHTDLPIYRSLIANVLRDRGHAVKGDLSKIYRRATS